MRIMREYGLSPEMGIPKSTENSNFHEPTVTFIIGNGFDLSMNMETSYKDFFKWYCRRGCRQELDSIKEQYVLFVKDKLSNPVRWNTWSDFESDLVAFASLTCTDMERQEFQSLFYDILDKIAEYIRENQLEVLSQLNLKDKTVYTKFGESILNWKNELTKEQKTSLENQIGCDVDFTDNNSEVIITDYKFICFNYSIVFDEVLHKAFGKKVKGIDIIHIHGKINRYPFDYNIDPVMGVDDALLIKTSFKEEELEYLLKNQNVDTLQERLNQEAEYYLRKSNIICIYGMSIGRTDSTWWKKIINWLKLEGHALVIFWHSSKKEELANKKLLRDSVMNRLFRFEDLRDDEKYYLKSKTQVVINPKEFLQVI